MLTTIRNIAFIGSCCAFGAYAQEAQTPDADKVSIHEAAQSIQSKLDASLEEFSTLQAEIAAEKLPMSKQLADLENELATLRADGTGTTRSLQEATLELANLQSRIKNRRDEVEYLSGLLSEYVRNFDASLHIAEVARYSEDVESALLAPENDNLSDYEVFEAQASLLEVSLERLVDALGGTRFEGSAVDPSGNIREGSFLMVGPAALFRSRDGQQVGTAEQNLNSLGPAVLFFADEEDSAAASELVKTGTGYFPLDPSLGDAHLNAATDLTVLEEVEKGGAVMVPILVMAGAALLVALLKWVHLLFFPRPGKRKIRALLEAIGRGDTDEAAQRVQSMRGPTGRMLRAGVANLDRPSELVEEVMFEDVLTTRLSAQRFLPFIAICATSAPLLGLLGTVTGIINTFKLITIYGSGDVKTLSGGISEALITTKYGLVVAIPSLLLHAFLWRKARAITSHMESSAMSFVNQVAKTPLRPGDPHGDLASNVVLQGDSDLVRSQVSQILGEMLGGQAQQIPVAASSGPHSPS